MLTIEFINPDGTKSKYKPHKWKKKFCVETIYQGRRKIKEIEYKAFDLKNDKYYIKNNEVLFFDEGFKFKRWEGFENQKSYIQIKNHKNKTEKEILMEYGKLIIVINDYKNDWLKNFVYRYDKEKSIDFKNFRIDEITSQHNPSNPKEASKKGINIDFNSETQKIERIYEWPKKSDLNDEQINTEALINQALKELKEAIEDLKYEPFVFINLEQETSSWLDSKNYPKQKKFEEVLTEYSIFGGMAINGKKHLWDIEQEEFKKEQPTKQEEPLTL